MKPVSVSTKDWIISLTAKELDVDEAICSKIISWSYLKAKEATKDVRSIELSGFGKLLVSPTKTKKRIDRREKRLIDYETRIREYNDEELIEAIRKKVEIVKGEIEYLKTKLENEVGEN